MDDNGEHLIQLPAITDEAEFERVFKTYFKNLHAYACTITKEEAAAEEVVQQVFVKLWERSEGLTISGSIAAYLYRAVYNESLNYLKHRKVRAVHQQYVEHSMKNVSEQAGKKLSLKELEGRLAQALNDLPEQCRTIFQMSRFEELRYKEIADRLGISVKTVENQMGKALKLLRVKLVEFLPLIMLGLLEIIKAIS
jgi:RNA polymerase sigma-70 factor (ECF subfamily)